MKHIKKFENKQIVKIREWAQFVGIREAACPAIKYPPLYTKIFETCELFAFHRNEGNQDGKLTLTNNVFDDLNWWKNEILHQVNPIRQHNTRL